VADGVVGVGAEELGAPWWKVVLAVNELAAHLAASVAGVGTMWALQRFSNYLMNGEMHLFRHSWAEFEVQWLFDFGDCGVFLALALRIVWIFFTRILRD
jgi:hypothetical protein